MSDVAVLQARVQAEVGELQAHFQRTLGGTREQYERQLEVGCRTETRSMLLCYLCFDNTSN